ncbi:DUF5412 domain-containing protein [Paenibacillus sp. P96]|uniref:DUF5412 domain-containing protein n=1 Tax=Paenibacillus zeirhizosphaerae TaxID=2987519 RepID=A0ABT9FWB4_9BACL|nr:DUF5412 family protein [Paenibacillus sp. P96]MDP4098995.1 DUF5412 domain-containing protein [Paenibacillus sp. P96]
MRKCNWFAFFLVLLLYIMLLYSLYSNAYNQWLIIPPNYIILIFSFIVLILAILGFQDKSSWFAKLRSWLSTILSSILILSLIIVMSFTAMFSGAKELLTTAHSPDEKYTINFYRTDAGAMGTFGISGELEGSLWFKKKIYFEQRVDQVDFEWENSHTILINNHKLDLMKSEPLIIQ